MRKAFFRGAAILLLALSVLCTTTQDLQFTASAAGFHRDPPIILIVRSSPNAVYESRQNIRIPGIERALRKAKQEEPLFSPFLSDMYVIVTQNGKEGLFRLEQTGNFWDEKDGKRFIMPGNISNKLLHKAEKLRTRHYGELMAWEEAGRTIVPLKSIFSVKDLETGLTFRVQRRAGSDHADVQPLTKQDTKTMKQIYHDRWSWRRKSILVHSNGRWFAASMNGMPHGGDGIPDNGFSGHFCIHFLNSTTHGADEPDPAHQLMVHKAAGDLRQYVNSASPLLLAQSFVVAMNHQDSEMVRLLIEEMETEKTVSLIRELDSLLSIRTIKQRELDQREYLYTATLSLDVELHRIGRAKQNTVFRFIFNRQTPHSPWRIQDVSLTQ